ncbi:MAG: hypothetical protein FJW80_03685 [Actinobacteria bacterium]|nr:hypothetical protein [Actinomycetota bacterium]
MTGVADLWQEAAELGGRGHYTTSWSTLDRLAVEEPRWASLALSMRGSHLRQVGDVRAAREHDARALALSCDDESRADALLGLAADDVAEGHAGAAYDYLERSGVLAAAGWRTLTRQSWVSAELALLEGDAQAAIDAGERALAACAGRSQRHEAKSLLVIDAARGSSTPAPVCGEAIVRAAPLMLSGGWATLEWPAALIADDLVRAGRATPDLTREIDALRSRGASAVLTVAAGLPEELRARWLDGPAARRLLPSDG